MIWVVLTESQLLWLLSYSEKNNYELQRLTETFASAFAVDQQERTYKSKAKDGSINRLG